MWTAKEDARYFSPIFGLPGYRHTSGVGRSWHFVDVYGFIITGRIFIPLLFVSGQWARMVADSWIVFPSAWNTFVHYANFRFPPEQDGFYAYNPLQPLVYFFIVFVFAPISILAGASMSPAMVNHFPRFPRIFGGRQGARSIHFLMMLCRLGFLAVHVTLAVQIGLERNLNHIVLGTDNLRPLGMHLGFVGLASVLGSWIATPTTSHGKRPAAAARTKGDFAASASGYPQSAQPAKPLYEGPNLAAFLAEWKNAGERGLETDGRKPL